MSIASAISAAQGKVADAYTAISNKGGTLPATQNLSNMPTAINSIPTGSSPVISSLSITPSTSAQTYDSSSVDGYKPVSVAAVTAAIDANITAGNIKSGVSILGVTGTYSAGYSELASYQVDNNGVASRRAITLTGTEFNDISEIDSYGLQYAFNSCVALTGTLVFSSLTTIGSSGMRYTFRGCTGLTAVDLSSVTTIDNYGMDHAFEDCSGITSVDLSSVVTIGTQALQYSFYNCTTLTSVDLSSVTTINANGISSAFYNCTHLTTVNLSSLTTITSYSMQYTFRMCFGLISIDLPLLTTFNGAQGMTRAFESCTNLEHVYFRALTTTSFASYTDIFINMLAGTGTNKTHTLHFPSNLQTTISGLSGYPNFGGSSGYVTLAFDLPATS